MSAPNERAELRGAQEAHGESLDEGARAAGRGHVDGVPQDEEEQVRRVAERRLNVAEHPHEREQQRAERRLRRPVVEPRPARRRDRLGPLREEARDAAKRV